MGGVGGADEDSIIVGRGAPAAQVEGGLDSSSRSGAGRDERGEGVEVAVVVSTRGRGDTQAALLTTLTFSD